MISICVSSKLERYWGSVRLGNKIITLDFVARASAQRRQAVIRREDVPFESDMGGGVGQLSGRKFQVGGVLDGQDVFVGVGLHGGVLLAWLCPNRCVTV